MPALSARSAPDGGLHPDSQVVCPYKPPAAIVAAAMRTLTAPDGDLGDQPACTPRAPFFHITPIRRRVSRLRDGLRRVALIALDFNPSTNAIAFAHAVQTSRAADVRRGLARHPEWATQRMDELLRGHTGHMASPWSILDVAVDALSRRCTVSGHAVLRLLLAYGADPLLKNVSTSSGPPVEPALLLDPLDITPPPRRWPADIPWDRALRSALQALGDIRPQKPENAIPAPAPGTPAFFAGLGYGPIMDHGRLVVSRGFTSENARWDAILCDLAAAALSSPTAQTHGWSTWEDLWHQAPLMIVQSTFYPGLPELLSSLWDRRRLACAAGLYAPDSWEFVTTSAFSGADLGEASSLPSGVLPPQAPLPVSVGTAPRPRRLM